MAREKELKDLFLDTLKDIYFAEKKILSALPKMAKAAQSPKLKAAFEKHMAETDGQVERLEQVFASIDETSKGKTCDAIVGIIEEGKEVMDEYKGMPALDAGPCSLPHRPSSITRFRVMAPSRPGQTNWVTPMQ
jgi:ferritin-like metal-binding protein YciE